MPCVAEVVNRSLKADCTDFKMMYNMSMLHHQFSNERWGGGEVGRWGGGGGGALNNLPLLFCKSV